MRVVLACSLQCNEVGGQEAEMKFDQMMLLKKKSVKTISLSDLGGKCRHTTVESSKYGHH